MTARVLHGQLFPMPLSALFLAGGFVGMQIGSAWRSRLDGRSLQRIFAIGMWLVAAWILAKGR